MKKNTTRNLTVAAMLLSLIHILTAVTIAMILHFVPAVMAFF